MGTLSIGRRGRRRMFINPHGETIVCEVRAYMRYVPHQGHADPEPALGFHRQPLERHG